MSRKLIKIRALMPIIPFLAIVLALLPLRVDAQQPAGDRNELVRTIGTAFRADDLAGARTSILEYLQLLPDDAAMLFNLACVESRVGAEDAALDALGRSVSAGWCDLDRIDTDPDLEALRDRDDFRQFVETLRTRLAETATEAGETLSEGTWSEPRKLHPNNGSPTDDLTPDVTAKLRYTQGSLNINVVVVTDHLSNRPEPWIYGDAVIVDVVVPKGETGFESDRRFSFAYGIEEGLPTGFYLNRHSASVQRRVMELSPKIKLHPGNGTASYSIVLPWTAVAPYAPPLDDELGINVLYTTVGEDGRRRVSSLVSAPEYLPAAEAPRRYALMRFVQSEQSIPVLRGHPNSTIVGARPLELNLCAWSPETGAGTLEVRIMDMGRESVVQSGLAIQPVDLNGGKQFWTRAADLSALPSGPFLVEAELTLPSGEKLSWGCNLLRLNHDWLGAVAENIESAPAVEFPLLEMRRKAIATALERHDPIDDPDDISRALVELGVLIKRISVLGSALPDSGVIAVAWPDREGQPQPAALSLPGGFDRSKSNKLLLVMTGAQTSQDNLAKRIARILGNRSDLAVLVPRPPAENPLRGDQVLADAVACLDWWRQSLNIETTLVAGIDLGASDALRLSLQRPDLFSEVLLAAGGDFNPWPGRNEEQVRRLLVPTPNTIAYHMVDFGAGGQGAAVAAGLQAAGFKLETSTAPDGPCSISQAAGLIAIWLAETP